MNATDLRTTDFDYDLPPELIAQTPAPRREESRLLVMDRSSGALEHTTFARIGEYLRPGDTLIANRSKVIPARIIARKATGGAVELLLLRPSTTARWTAMCRPSRKLRPGMIFEIPSTGLRVMLRETLGAGEWEIEFEGEGEGDLDARIRASGTLPLPPYIRNEDAPLDRYQTVYADRDGSIAAPTAGLHFSEELIASLRQSGIHFGKVTLHVGAGTFKPVSADRIQDHHMHAEWGEVPEETATLVGETHARGGRVVAVGTTSSRLLESAWRDGAVRTFTGDTSLFIYPGYRFRAIDGLVTNFHLPRSTLLMLISALAGRERVLHAYEEAVRLRYRFYSFGDAMLIL